MDIMCTLIAVSHSSSWISLMYIVTCHDHSSATSSESRNAHSLGFFSLWPNSLVPTVFPHRSSKWKLLQLKWVIPRRECSRLDYIFITGSPARETSAQSATCIVWGEEGLHSCICLSSHSYIYFFSLSCSDGHPKDLQKYFFEGVSAHFNKPLVVTSPNYNWCYHLRQ